MKNALKDKVKLAVVVENYMGITTKLKTLPNGNSSGHATGDWEIKKPMLFFRYIMMMKNTKKQRPIGNL